MSKPTFLVEVVSHLYLQTDEVWPDNDAPDNPTTEDVIKAMIAYGSRNRVIKEWCLDDFSVLVDGVEVDW